MNQQISRKIEEVADLPKFRLPLNLQLFADDEELIDLETDDQGTAEQEDDNYEATDVRGKQETDEDVETIVDEEKEEQETKKVDKEKQSKETNDAFQEMRKKTEAAELRASQAEAKRIRDLDIAKKHGKDGIYSDEDVANKFGASHGITTVEQYEQAIEKEKYVESGLPPELVDELLESRRERQERKQKEQVEQSQKHEKLLVDNFADLQKEYPDLVKSPGDVSPEVWAIFNNGSNPAMTLIKAFKAENFDLITSKVRASEKQRTLNALNSKKHLSTEGDGGSEQSDDVNIDSETMEYYKGMGMTKAQATKHHKKLYG